MNLQSKMKNEITVEHVPSSNKQIVTGCSVLETLYYLFVLVIIHFVYPSPHTLEMEEYRGFGSGPRKLSFFSAACPGQSQCIGGFDFRWK